MVVDYSHFNRNPGRAVYLTRRYKEAILIDLIAIMDQVINLVDLNLFIEKRHKHGLTAHKIQRG
mgnify:FL=1